MRSNGVSVGRNASVDWSRVLEPDLVTIGGDVVVAENALVQPHTFEHRVMKLQRVKIGSGSVIGPNAIILAGATVQDRVFIEANTLILRNDDVPSQPSHLCQRSRNNEERCGKNRSSANKAGRANSTASWRCSIWRTGRAIKSLAWQTAQGMGTGK